MNQDFIENNLLIIPKKYIERFLDQDNPQDIIALYIQKYYLKKWGVIPYSLDWKPKKYFEIKQQLENCIKECEE